jgi:hypothetical protein
MGNLCSLCFGSGKSDKKIREKVERQLFDLYDRTGEFTLSNNEMRSLSLFLYNKKDLQYQERIEKISAVYGKFKELGPVAFVKKSIGENNPENLTFENFIILTRDASISEMKTLLHEAKQNEVSILQQELAKGA